MEQREQRIRSLLGQLVHVEVDRPIGYVHGDIVYPVNYGYIPGLIAPDGEDQDAYILGVSEPLRTFDGRVIGAVRRKNDCEDKMIVVPDGLQLNQAQIAEAVHFQEQYFDYSIDSLLRKSCGVIPWRQTPSGYEFLLLLQNNHSWSFPKGHMERGETEIETALRELREEAGLTAELMSEARIVLEHPTRRGTWKQVILFLGQVQGDVALQPEEIAGYLWLPLEKLKEHLRDNAYSAVVSLLHYLP